ncbi:acyltransferase family protein [Curtobacterium sp. NPDC089689]|uniref:acyltransferase family protein n=1 Tax=Curtobacterium sp. NPDC089689 TaxID=3363968 RepID=UPI00382F8F84
MDALRLAAAVAVVLFHYTAITSAWGEPFRLISPVLFNVSKFGYFGVDLFFVISGFVILMSAWGRPLNTFIASRVSRLFPAYWFAVFFTGVLLLLTAPDDISGQQLLVNLTMGQSAFGVRHVDGVFWTLWVEMHFYALIGVFLLIGITRARLLAVCALWPVVAVIARASDAHFLASLLQPTYAPLFAGGMMIYLLSLDRRSLISWIVLAANVLWAIPTAGNDAASSVRRLTGAGINDSVTVGVTVLCFALVIAVTLTALRRVAWRWLTIAGLLTYPLYLLHEQLGWWLISVLQSRASWPLVLVTALAASVAVSVVAYRVEKAAGPRLRMAIDRGLAALVSSDRRRGSHRSESS